MGYVIRRWPWLALAWLVTVAALLVLSVTGNGELAAVAVPVIFVALAAVLWANADAVAQEAGRSSASRPVFDAAGLRGFALVMLLIALAMEGTLLAAWVQRHSPQVRAHALRTWTEAVARSDEAGHPVDAVAEEYLRRALAPRGIDVRGVSIAVWQQHPTSDCTQSVNRCGRPEEVVGVWTGTLSWEQRAAGRAGGAAWAAKTCDLVFAQRADGDWFLWGTRTCDGMLARSR